LEAVSNILLPAGDQLLFQKRNKHKEFTDPVNIAEEYNSEMFTDKTKIWFQRHAAAKG
jgi:hypothetical protein